MGFGRYILHGRDAVEEPDLATWAAWYEASFGTKRRVVAQTPARMGAPRDDRRDDERGRIG